MEILEQMEFDRKEPAGGDITPTAAVDAINVTAKQMEVPVSYTHLTLPTILLV